MKTQAIVPVGGIVVPSAVDKLKARLRAELAQLDAAVVADAKSSAPHIDSTTMVQWQVFAATVNAYCAAPTSWFSLGTQMDTGQAFEAQLGDWTKRFSALGVGRLPPAPRPAPSVADDVKSIGTTLLTIAAVGVGGYLLLQLLRR